MNLFLAFYFFFFWISKISSETIPENENEMMLIQPFSYISSPVAKPEGGEKNDKASTNSWPEISFLDRILSTFLSPPKLLHQTTTPKPPSILDRNETEELPIFAIDGDQVEKTDNSPKAPESENDLMPIMQTDSYNPPSLVAKPDREEGKNKVSAMFWPEIPFLERILWSFLSPPELQHHQTSAPKPRIYWRFRFTLTKNVTDETPTVANDEDLTEKTGSTRPILDSAEEDWKFNTIKRGKKGKGSQPAKKLFFDDDFFKMLSPMKLEHSSPTEDDQNTDVEGKSTDKSLKDNNGEKYRKYSLISRNGIIHHFNKSTNGTRMNCYRRFYTYMWTIDWTALFMHILVVLIFVFILTMAIVYCQALANSVQVDVKRINVNPAKLNKAKGVEVYSMC